uniref:Putative secreted protein n=1 Tax=Amblyomma triste TaxID=251400 RepID=A0A023G096_AMBTT
MLDLVVLLIFLALPIFPVESGFAGPGMQPHIYCEQACYPLRNGRQCKPGCICSPKMNNPRIGMCTNKNTHRLLAIIRQDMYLPCRRDQQSLVDKC